MSNTFENITLEIDSSYRDRNKYPLPSDFTLDVNVERKNEYDAIDPVCLTMPVKNVTDFFREQDYNVDDITLLSSDISNLNAVGIRHITNPLVLAIRKPTNSGNDLSIYNDAYVGCTLLNTLTNVSRRISSYEFVVTSSGFLNNAIITVEYPFPDRSLVSGTRLEIWSGVTTQWDALFIPSSVLANEIDNFLDFEILNETRNEVGIIRDQDIVLRTIRFDNSQTVRQWNTSDILSVRRRNVGNMIVAEITNITINSSTTTITINTSLSSTKDLRGSFLFFRSSRKILRISSNNEYDIIVEDNDSIISTSLISTTVEIHFVSFDNVNPINNFLGYNKEFFCELQLKSLLLPNQKLGLTRGGTATALPYVYVQFSNLNSVSGSNTGTGNLIISNNPNSFGMTFRAVIEEYPTNTNNTELKQNFIRFTSDMKQQVWININTQFQFKIILPNGILFDVITPEFYSPNPPNPFKQISATFALKIIKITD